MSVRDGYRVWALFKNKLKKKKKDQNQTKKPTKTKPNAAQNLLSFLLGQKLVPSSTFTWAPMLSFCHLMAPVYGMEPFRQKGQRAACADTQLISGTQDQVSHLLSPYILKGNHTAPVLLNHFPLKRLETCDQRVFCSKVLLNYYVGKVSFTGQSAGYISN